MSPLAALPHSSNLLQQDDIRGLWGSAALLLIGSIGGLFPDLDAPESELLHAPRRLALGAGRIATATLGVYSSSLIGMFVRSLFWLPGALVGGVVAGLSCAIRSITHHRGLTHELRGLLLFTSLVLLLTSGLASLWRLPPPMALRTTLLVGGAWTLGYLTHLLLDAATVSGIPLLSSRRIFHLLPRGRRIRTGTWPDTVLLRSVARVWLVVMLTLALFA